MLPRKIIVVGAGPIGSLFALKYREQYPNIEDVQIHIFDKRKTAGNRLEMLYILEDSFKQLTKKASDYLLNPEEKNGTPRAFYSPLTFNQMVDPVKPVSIPHVTLTISDLENALCQQLQQTPGINLYRGMEFLKHYQENDKFIAEFIDLSTNTVVKKEYDEMIFSVGLSASLDHPQFKAARLLHSFPTVAAEYAKDNQHFNPLKNPTQVTYCSQTGLVGVAITPAKMTVFTSVPPNINTSKESVQLEQIQRAIDAIPDSFKHFLKDIGKPTAIKSITATTTLSPQFTDDKLHTHSIGDMVATFPYVYGSETNSAYTFFIPHLLKHLKNIEIHPHQRESYSKKYSHELLEYILGNENFLRILPFGETISLGKQFIAENGMPAYQFPGMDALLSASPMSRKKDTFQLLEEKKDTKIASVTAFHLFKKLNGKKMDSDLMPLPSLRTP